MQLFYIICSSFLNLEDKKSSYFASWKVFSEIFRAEKPLKVSKVFLKMELMFACFY